MKEFKGTPGPWDVTTWKDISFSEVARDTYHQVSAGRGYFDDETGNGFGISGFMTQYDAHLIAAAPELLEVLQQCIPHLREQSKNDGHAFGTLQLVNRIIAKALGETK